MPLYTIECPSTLLDFHQKEQICREITCIHCAMTGAVPTFVNVVIHTTDDNVEFVNNKLRFKARIVGLIRVGRSAATKESIISQINDAWIKVVGERCHIIRLDEMEPENVAEDGTMIPAAGKELEWLAKNQKTFEERAERGEELSQDLLADLKTMQFKTS